MYSVQCTVGCSIPNTLMEYWQDWPRAGCCLTPIVSIQNPDPEKFQELRERGLANYSALKKTESQTCGGNGEKKDRVQELLDSVFSHHSSPMSGTLLFFRTLKLAIPLSLSHFLKFFRIRVLDTHYGCQAAVCTGSAPTKFHLSVGDGAT